MNNYNPQKIEQKWQSIWEKSKINEAREDKPKNKYYCLDMFPYPSGSGLHVGHWRGYVLSDVAARIKKIQGYDVLHPMGWDAFGLPAENDAIKKGKHPKENTEKNIENIKKQLMQIGSCFDWSREIDTTDPDYYKWTQWIFLQMWKKGLAYEKEMPINWCPSCKVGLANEEVVSGKCERCGAEVSKKNLKQWMLKITDHADRLLKDLDKLNWPEKVKKMQADWIGKSEGTEIEFRIKNYESGIKVFTTRIDTIFSATYMLLSPENPLVEKITTDEQRRQVDKYIKQTEKRSFIERTDIEKEKTGVFTGSYVVNPVNGDEMPIWISDFVLADYGTGAVFADAHDKRDFEMAKKYNLPLKVSIKPKDGKLWEKVKNLKECYPEDGILVNSDQFDGLTSAEARKKITEWLEKKKIGKKVINYKLRDWIFSRQRYWGEPIPLVHCDKCGVVPLDEKDLPLLLPEVKKYEPTGTGESPLADIEEWVNTKCPKCGGKAKRETNTMPQWAGSCWYFLAYALGKSNLKSKISNLEGGLGNKTFAKKLKYWLPVDLYVGGIEHAVLHLLYSRFWIKFLYDIKAVEFDEPFSELFNQGMVYRVGAKMSKSKGNIVSPDELIQRYGTDALRAYELFMAPPDQDAEWNDSGVPGTSRFLNKVWNLATELTHELTHELSSKELLWESFEIGETELQVQTHKVIKKYNEGLEKLHYNTLVSTLMEFTNYLQAKKELLKKYPQPVLVLIILLSPICPHISEELWEEFGFDTSIFSGKYGWPKYNPDLIKEESVNIVVQENGKFRGNIEVNAGAKEEEAVKTCNEIDKFKEIAKDCKKVVYVQDRLINFVK